jgi:hypothetical protein
MESEAVPEIPPDAAVTVTAPTVTLLASPYVPLALLMVATVESLVLQCTTAVRSCVLPSA